jgi:hypothetical protein
MITEFATSPCGWAKTPIELLRILVFRLDVRVRVPVREGSADRPLPRFRYSRVVALRDVRVPEAGTPVMSGSLLKLRLASPSASAADSPLGASATA